MQVLLPNFLRPYQMEHSNVRWTAQLAGTRLMLVLAVDVVQLMSAEVLPTPATEDGVEGRRNSVSDG